MKERQDNSREGYLLVITGKAGAGKDAVLGKLFEAIEDLEQIVTYATRDPRADEVHGVHYNFANEQEFLEMVERDEFLEQVKYGKTYKGTHKNSILGVLEGKKVVWRIDISRAATVEETFRERFPEDIHTSLLERTIVVLLDLPDSETAKKRVIERDGDGYDEEEFVLRHTQDSEVLSKYTFQHTVVNHQGKLEETVSNVIKINEERLGGR